MDEMTIEELVMQSLGQASMCWSETPKGVFDSEAAAKVGKKLLEWIEDYVGERAQDIQTD